MQEAQRKGLVLEVLTAETVQVVDFAELGRMTKKGRGPRTGLGNCGSTLQWEQWSEEESVEER